MTTVAAISALAAPVVLVAATTGDSISPLEAARGETVSAVHPESSSQAVRFISGTSEALRLGPHPVRSQIEGIQGLPSTTIPALPPVTVPAAPTTTVPAPTTTTVAPPPAAPAAPPAGTYGDPADPATWDRLAKCEAGGNWATNTGNGYYGGLQFSASSWRGVGGTGLPHQNSRETQIEMGRRLQARAGWSQWPACTRKLGYR